MYVTFTRLCPNLSNLVPGHNLISLFGRGLVSILFKCDIIDSLIFLRFFLFLVLLELLISYIEVLGYFFHPIISKSLPTNPRKWQSTRAQPLAFPWG